MTCLARDWFQEQTKLTIAARALFALSKARFTMEKRGSSTQLAIAGKILKQTGKTLHSDNHGFIDSLTKCVRSADFRCRARVADERVERVGHEHRQPNDARA
jgi:hypothetical protein